MGEARDWWTEKRNVEFLGREYANLSPAIIAVLALCVSTAIVIVAVMRL